MPNLNLTEEELAATAKAVDVHRQALVRKLGRIGNSNQGEQTRTLEEIQSCSAASAKMRVVLDAQLAESTAARRSA